MVRPCVVCSLALLICLCGPILSGLMCVRAAEFQQGHLPGAVNIPHTDITSRIQQLTSDKNAQIQLYCRSGRRSGLAAAELKKLGYQHVVNAGAYQQLLTSPNPLSSAPKQQ